MSNFSDGIIRDVDNIDFSEGIVTNVTRVEEVTTQEKAIGDIIIKFRLNIDDYNKLQGMDSLSSITFFDWVGFGETFKQLFDEFKRNTNLSKGKISVYLRHTITGESISNGKIEFKFVVPKSYLVEKQELYKMLKST